MSGFGYSRLNESGNGNNPLPKNQRYVPEPYNMNGNNPLPRRIKKTIQQHPVSKHFYSTITYTNHNGKVNEKFVYVSQNGTQIKDKDKDIYLNKATGDIISGNGRKYAVDPHSKSLVRNSNGYVFQDNNNNNQLPKRSSVSLNTQLRKS
jgi:hypothetical protein